MNEVISKVKLMTKMFLQDEDFIVRELIETEKEIRIIIVSSFENVEKLLLIKRKHETKNFVDRMTNILNMQYRIKEIAKRVFIETEALCGSRR